MLGEFHIDLFTRVKSLSSTAVRFWRERLETRVSAADSKRSQRAAAASGAAGPDMDHRQMFEFKYE